MTADLNRKATLETMARLGSAPAPGGSAVEGLEAPGREPTTPPDRLASRRGYDPEFLGGWRLPLPLATGDRKADMTPLRRGGQGVELKYQNFSVVMSASRRLPMITAANINGAEARRLPRISTWSFDGRLDKDDQWGDALYDRNALDRGHMVRREDPVWGTFEVADAANRDTFHFTNSCPQMAGVNQKTWLGLEDHILRHAKADRMRVNVYTGPFFGEDDLEYRGALVPKAFWKVVAIVTEDGRPSATAYKVDQVKELSDLEFVFAGYRTFQISIRQVIKATGLDFEPLVEYDGFSQHEAVHGLERLEEALESLDQVRV